MSPKAKSKDLKELEDTFNGVLPTYQGLIEAHGEADSLYRKHGHHLTPEAPTNALGDASSRPEVEEAFQRHQNEIMNQLQPIHDAMGELVKDGGSVESARERLSDLVRPLPNRASVISESARFDEKPAGSRASSPSPSSTTTKPVVVARLKALLMDPMARDEDIAVCMGSLFRECVLACSLAVCLLQDFLRPDTVQQLLQCPSMKTRTELHYGNGASTIDLLAGKIQKLFPTISKEKLDGIHAVAETHRRSVLPILEERGLVNKELERLYMLPLVMDPASAKERDLTITAGVEHLRKSMVDEGVLWEKSMNRVMQSLSIRQQAIMALTVASEHAVITQLKALYGRFRAQHENQQQLPVPLSTCTAKIADSLPEMDLGYMAMVSEEADRVRRASVADIGGGDSCLSPNITPLPDISTYQATPSPYVSTTDIETAGGSVDDEGGDDGSDYEMDGCLLGQGVVDDSLIPGYGEGESPDPMDYSLMNHYDDGLDDMTLSLFPTQEPMLNVASFDPDMIPF